MFAALIVIGCLAYLVIAGLVSGFLKDKWKYDSPEAGLGGFFWPMSVPAILGRIAWTWLTDRRDSTSRRTDLPHAWWRRK